MMTPAAVARIAIGNCRYIAGKYASKLCRRRAKYQRIEFGYNHKWIVNATHRSRFATRQIGRAVHLKMKTVVSVARVRIELYAFVKNLNGTLDGHRHAEQNFIPHLLRNLRNTLQSLCNAAAPSFEIGNSYRAAVESDSHRFGWSPNPAAPNRRNCHYPRRIGRARGRRKTPNIAISTLNWLRTPFVRDRMANPWSPWKFHPKNQRNFMRNGDGRKTKLRRNKEKLANYRYNNLEMISITMIKKLELHSDQQPRSMWNHFQGVELLSMKNEML